MTVVHVLACLVDTVPCPVESQAWVPVQDLADFAALGIDAASILYVFSWGAGAILSMWAIGYAIGAAATALGKA